jgi:ABC-2 type transport system permease protein
MPAQDPWASVRAAWASIRINMAYQLTYPHELFTDMLQMGLQMLVYRQVWIALYGGRDARAGVTLAQAVTYQLVNVIVVRLFSTWILAMANNGIRSGDIVFQIARPMTYEHIWFYEFAGQAVTKLLTTSLPMYALVCLITRPTLPSSTAVWLSFGLSLGLGFLTAFYVDYILSLIGFWTTALGGLFWAKESILMVLGGTYLPLWIYPPALRRILAFLPFQGISYTPVAILIGQIDLSEVPRAFAVQVVWLVLMAVVSRRLYAAAMVRLAVQGG